MPWENLKWYSVTMAERYSRTGESMDEVQRRISQERPDFITDQAAHDAMVRSMK
jgi:hypothetical protein